ncbi:MAG TPA: hypothetical protein VFJ57_12115 [Solirubrobacterales bacterium]|nr:hypothetical protein [Solirubrobacterales bacterium]
MSSPIEETYWTAKEWSARTRVPYRTILAAAAHGELAAIRPSGSANGLILISESAWTAWTRGARLRVKVPERIAVSTRSVPTGDLSDLALS